MIFRRRIVLGIKDAASGILSWTRKAQSDLKSLYHPIDKKYGFINYAPLRLCNFVAAKESSILELSILNN